MMPEFLIQRWTSSERLDDIMAIVHAAFAEITPPSGVLSETAADLAARQRNEVVLVAMAGADFVGSLFCARKGDALYLTRMATRPDWRKRGVGRALMEEADRLASAGGQAKLLIRVRKSLPGNLAYFTAKGFVVTGEGQDPGREPYDVMERVLA